MNQINLMNLMNLNVSYEDADGYLIARINGEWSPGALRIVLADIEEAVKWLMQDSI